jgi:hypothetical protein
MSSPKPSREPYYYGWVCHLCSNCNYCNYKDLFNMQQTSKCKRQHEGNAACPHVHGPPSPDMSPPYSIPCSLCEEVVYLMPWNLKGVTDIPAEFKVMDGKIAEKEKGWGCLECHTMWGYEKDAKPYEVKVCKNCGERDLQQWVRVLKISDADERRWLSDAEHEDEGVKGVKAVKR